MQAEGGKRILLVEDDEIFASVLLRAMEKRGYLASHAASASEALELASREPPDYAVVDLKLGRDSGLDCLPALREINPAMRMVIVTGYSSIATAVSAIKMGAANYACKPVDADEILALLLREEVEQPTGAEVDVPEQPISVDRLEWEHIQKVLHDHAGNISATARSLGMHRRTLQRKLQKRPVRK